MYGLLGAHLHSAGGNWVNDLYQWKPPVVLSYDHSTSVFELIQHSPKTIIVGRMPPAAQPPFDDPLDVRALASQHVSATLPQANRAGGAYKFWQCLVNEPVIATPDGMRRYAEYTCHVLEMMDTEGFTAAIGHFGAGNPPHFGLWNEFVPAMREALAYESVLCLHEYAWPSLLDTDQWPWLLMRHKSVYNGTRATAAEGWNGMPADLKALRCIVTEAGIDSGVAGITPFRGWRDVPMSPDLYMAELAGYNAALMSDPYILGACLWDFGGGGSWASAEHYPEMSSRLAANATPVYRWYDNPIEPPAPGDERWSEVADQVSTIQAILAQCH